MLRNLAKTGCSTRRCIARSSWPSSPYTGRGHQDQKGETRARDKIQRFEAIAFLGAGYIRVSPNSIPSTGLWAEFVDDRVEKRPIYPRTPPERFESPRSFRRRPRAITPSVYRPSSPSSGDESYCSDCSDCQPAMKRRRSSSSDMSPFVKSMPMSPVLPPTPPESSVSSESS